MNGEKKKTAVPIQSAATDLEQSLCYVAEPSIAEASFSGKTFFAGRRGPMTHYLTADSRMQPYLWADKQGRVFLHFPVKELAAALHRRESAVKAALSALEQVGLITRQRQGIGKPTRIYVRLPDHGKPTMRRSENRLSEGHNSGSQSGGNPSTNKNKRIITTDTNYRDYDCGEDESL